MGLVSNWQISIHRINLLFKCSVRQLHTLAAQRLIQLAEAIGRAHIYPLPGVVHAEYVLRSHGSPKQGSQRGRLLFANIFEQVWTVYAYSRKGQRCSTGAFVGDQP